MSIANSKQLQITKYGLSDSRADASRYKEFHARGPAMEKASSPRQVSTERLLCLQTVWNLVSSVCVMQIYCDWANHYLVKVGHCDRLVNDLQTDLCDGVLLADIIQSVSK